MANQSFREATKVTKLLNDTYFGATQDESPAHDGSGWDDRSCQTSDLVNAITLEWQGLSPISAGSGKRRAAGQASIQDTVNTPLQAFGWFGVHLKFPSDAVSLNTIEFERRGNAGEPAGSIIYAFYDTNTHTLLNLSAQTKFNTVSFTPGVNGALISADANGLLVPANREMYLLMKGANETFDTAADIMLAAAEPFDAAGMRANNVSGTSGHVFAIPDGTATPPVDLSGSVDGSGAGYNFEAAILFTYNI